MSREGIGATGWWRWEQSSSRRLEEVPCCHSVNITPLFQHLVFRLLSFHATNEHIRRLLHSQLQKLCIQTWNLFAFRSRESGGLYPGSRCLCLHMQVFQRFMIMRNTTIPDQSIQHPGTNTGGDANAPNMLIGHIITRNRNLIYLYQHGKVHEKVSLLVCRQVEIKHIPSIY